MSLTSNSWIPALFNMWGAAGISYVVLRNYEMLPADEIWGGNPARCLRSVGKANG